MTISEVGEFTSPLIPETWEQHLLRRQHDHPMTCLEFGIGDGRPASWLLNNLLTFEDDQYYGIDNPVSEQAHRNLSHFGEKARVMDIPVQGIAAVWMWWPAHWPMRDYDVVHITPTDAKTWNDYTRVGWHVLREDGVLIWDHAYPRRGGGFSTLVDDFLKGLDGKWEVLWRKVQMAIVKTAE